MNPHCAGPAFRFGTFELDLCARQLRKHGRTVRMQDHPFSILAYLLQHPGDLVTREELRRILWPDGTIVDFENGLNTAMGKLRQALRDSAGNPRFIETIPRRGYRFIGVLEPVAQPPEVPVPPPPDLPRPPPAHRLWWIAVAVVSTILLARGDFAPPASRSPRGNPAGKQTLTILPFQNLDVDAPDQYLADGITEELTTRLSRLQPLLLRVIVGGPLPQYRNGPATLSREAANSTQTISSKAASAAPAIIFA